MGEVIVLRPYCAYPACKEKAFVSRRSRAGEWFTLCFDHWCLVLKCGEPDDTHEHFPYRPFENPNWQKWIEVLNGRI